MKLRLKGNEGNSLRLRVSRSEMERLLRGEAVVEEVCFGNGAGTTFRYALIGSAATADITLETGVGTVTVLVPAATLTLWGQETEVGIYTEMAVPNGKLAVVLEKDFACLDRADEDNADMFSHPHAEAAC